MSSLAAFAINQGHKVSGSDRSNDAGQFPEKFQTLQNMGINLYPQDGSGINQTVDYFVTSTAVEPHIPDVKAALDNNIKILKRAEYLAELINTNIGITIAGTSGKSTVTAMAGHIFSKCNKEPNVLNGAVLLNDYGSAQLGLGNTLVGKSDLFIAEACESDGTIVTYKPHIELLHNVTLDHKDLDELKEIFDTYLSNAKQQILLNLDDEECLEYVKKYTNAKTYSIENTNADIYASNILMTNDGLQFTVHQPDGSLTSVNMPLYGEHNVSNALAAISCAVTMGISLQDAAIALKDFAGIKSRMEFKGKTTSGVTVIDDYAHNPDKLAATINTVNQMSGRNIFFYQPHGFGPTKMLKDGYIDVFSSLIKEDDILILSEIFYAGGTADKSISSKDLVDEIIKKHSKTYFANDKSKAEELIAKNQNEADRILIMGARDDSLRDFAERLTKTL